MAEARGNRLASDSVSGTTLAAELERSGNLVGILPECSAIYLWKLLVQPEVSRHDPVGLMQHVSRITSLPQGRLESIAVGRGMRIEEFLIGGVGLTAKKVEELERLVSTRQGASSLWQYLSFLQSQVPAIYVGETGDLPRRIREHLTGASDFGSSILQDGSLGWSDLMLEYVRTGEQGDDEHPARRALEYLTSLLTIASYTQRPG